MKIKIIVDPVSISCQSLASCVAPAPAMAMNGITDVPQYSRDPLSQSQDLTVSFSHRGPGCGHGCSPRGRNRHPNKIAADLNAEMEVIRLQFPIVFSYIHASGYTTASNTSAALPLLQQLNHLDLLLSIFTV